MGMFDWIDYECVCPICRSKVDGFQSKDGVCELEHLKPQDVEEFYSSCKKCGSWLEFEKEKPNKYRLTVYKKSTNSEILYSKLKTF